MTNASSISEVTKQRIVTVVRYLDTSNFGNKIPTTFVPLGPEKILIEGAGIDVLVGVFHIMWEDMPRRRTYAIRLAESVSLEGRYLGASLNCGSGKALEIAL